ncbi:hypothetical protein FPE01S_01_00040 [Flavihumibacter petaseus NBRC 106054]|uniref:Porin n=2 Tax=Flavihumibacter TaxID=1004301 RepID=A0A0E9MU41_9BACT|nr:hypothetical protein FPE01S_01_00040 [Flavihumibacter petaseus NBRC 106054]
MLPVKVVVRALLPVVILCFLGNGASAQLEQSTLFRDTTVRGDSIFPTYPNTTSGEFTPGKGFSLVKTKIATLNLSIYAMVRYLNQMPGKQTWQDHLGRDREFTGRNDFHWHRAMLWFSGQLFTPKLTYVATVWSVMTTQQTLVYGNIQYRFNKNFTLAAGIMPNISVRSMQGPFPFYLSTDRTMGEESLRAGFTNGITLKGEIVPRLNYALFLGNNLSTLGVQAAKLTRTLSKGVGLTWMPTTGEYGPRGGLIDFENHKEVSTRFGMSYTHDRDNRFNNTGQPSPDNTQVRMTDGVLFFETGALADGVTVQEANYDMIAFDLGVKYKGFNAQAEIYNRVLSKFDTDGPVPINRIQDVGYSLQLSHMVVPKILNVYVIHSYFFDEFKRHPWELGGGVNVYPFKSRSWRLNGQLHHVYKSSAGGTFGLYTAGQTGTTVTIGTDILL